MRRLAFVLPFLAALPLHAETLSAEIGRTGLAAVETRLSALPQLTDEERFTLGGVEFLRAVEISFQMRWRENLTDSTGMLPFLRLPIAANPKHDPFQPATIVGIFQAAEAELAKAHANLTAIPETSDFGAPIRLDTLWFDVNSNGTRDPGEDLPAVLSGTFSRRPTATESPPSRLTIRFDVADAAWLAAYTDLLTAVCDMVQAYDPTAPIARVLDAHRKMADLGPLKPELLLKSTPRIPDEIDMLAIVLATLQQQPDATRTAAARDHLLSMVAWNRVFWQRVARETDDDAEWLPNAQQHSAMGFDVPTDAAAAWGAVLADMEAALKGDKLIAYWRVGPPAGLNLAKMFAEPRPIDIPGWIQGWAALPYLQQGTLVTSDALAAFSRAVQGNTMLFALWFN